MKTEIRTFVPLVCTVYRQFRQIKFNCKKKKKEKTKSPIPISKRSFRKS